MAVFILNALNTIEQIDLLFVQCVFMRHLPWSEHYEQLEKAQPPPGARRPLQAVASDASEPTNKHDRSQYLLAEVIMYNMRRIG